MSLLLLSLVFDNIEILRTKLWGGTRDLSCVTRRNLIFCGPKFDVSLSRILLAFGNPTRNSTWQSVLLCLFSLNLLGLDPTVDEKQTTNRKRKRKEEKDGLAKTWSDRSHPSWYGIERERLARDKQHSRWISNSIFQARTRTKLTVCVWAYCFLIVYSCRPGRLVRWGIKRASNSSRQADRVQEQLSVIPARPSWGRRSPWNQLQVGCWLDSS